ncbi:microcephalin [Episyrphus balteatus]|uniref:microcephalin n=1 Tax=Episyrphus balteatus TaxID=286459 RepID=UPI002485A47E|nr:microcephalin [Episyrphus balteatus]
MDRFVTRAPTWKTLEMSSFSRSFANVSLTGKKSTPKEDKSKVSKLKSTSDKRLSIRDENLLKIISSQADEPLMVASTLLKHLSPTTDRFNGSFGGNGNTSAVAAAAVSDKNNVCLIPINDENTPPPNARINFKDQQKLDVLYNSNSGGGKNGSRPSTPINNMIPSNLGSCTPKDNPFMARIQRDLNSPSAATRVRAIKALRSPTKSAYGNFDIPHEEQDIITEEERSKSPVKIKSIQELMKDVVVYVEVRTGEDNRSSGVKKVISALGAKVNDKLLRDTTHVVFKDGLLSTYNKAKKWNIPIVSILWIEACKKQMRLMAPKDFPISNADRYENPELYDKMKRYKSMQPDAEDNRRAKTKAPTKENGLKSKAIPATAPAITPTLNSAKKKTDITRFLTQLDSKKIGTPKSSAVEASPSTQMLQRINETFCTPKTPSNSLQKLAYLDTVSSLSDTNEPTSQSVDAKKMLDFVNEESIPATPSTKKTPGRPRRNSIQVSQTPSKNIKVPEVATPDVTIAETPGVRTRRRSSIHIPAKMSIVDKEKEKLSKTTFNSICEEISDNTKPEVEKRQTTFTEQSVDMTRKNSEIAATTSTQKNRRRTLYTPNTMEESRLQSIKPTPSASKRRTIFATSTHKAFDDTSISGLAPITPIGSGVPCSTLIVDDLAKTPVQYPSLLEEHASATIFNSAKTPANPRRRTLFDVSMDIISQRLQNINQSAKSVRVGRLDDQSIDIRSSQDDPEIIATLLTPTENNNKLIRKELFVEKEASVQNQVPIADVPSQTAIEPIPTTPIEVVTKKKRKLFVPNDILLTPTSSQEDSTAMSKRILSPAASTVSTPATQKRRKTIMPTLTQPKTEQKKTAPKINGARTSRRSTMDFEAIKKAKSVINQKPSAGTTKSTNDTTTSTASKPKPYPFLVYTNMHTEQIDFIKEAVSKLQGFQLESNVSDNTTHIVSLEPRRTFNLLRGLVRGLWIVNYNWVVDSVKAGQWLNEEQYEMQEFSSAVEICRSQRQAFGTHYKMDIFSALGPMFISSKSTIPKNNLSELITLCAGRVVDNRKRAKYIIGDSSPNPVADKIYVQPQWILDSISNNSIQKITKYIVNASTEQEVAN